MALAGWGGSTHAAGTGAGTLIPNSATLTYSYNGRAQAPVTATAPNVAVAEVINVVLTWQDGAPIPVNSPDTGRVLSFLLTNTGNGTETFRLTRNNALEGDKFDPTSVSDGAIYLESGAQAGFQASGPNADILYVPGLNDPALAADASRIVYVLSGIPASLGTGATGNVSLAANSTTPGASGARPGTALAGLGQRGVDAVVGASRAQSSSVGGYLVAGISLGLAKTVAAVRDSQGGTRVMPGSVLTYRIVLTLTGTGIAENLAFSDPLPATTRYVPGSLTVDGTARTDAADGDNASVAAGTVSVLFGSIPVPASRVIEFKATVN